MDNKLIYKAVSERRKDALYFLAESDHEPDRIYLAGREGVHTDLMEQLATDPSKKVRLDLAKNKDINNVTMFYLSLDKDKEVRQALLSNNALDNSIRTHMMTI